MLKIIKLSYISQYIFAAGPDGKQNIWKDMPSFNNIRYSTKRELKFSLMDSKKSTCNVWVTPPTPEHQISCLQVCHPVGNNLSCDIVLNKHDMHAWNNTSHVSNGKDENHLSILFVSV